MKKATSIISLPMLALLVLVVSLCSVARAQGTTQYPASPDTDTTLPRAVDGKATFTTASVTSSATSIVVNSTAGVPSAGVLQIDAELLSYSTADATHFTVTRAFSGTTAVAHAATATVRFPLASAHVNGLQGAVLALEAKLGFGSSPASGASTGAVPTKQGDGSTQWIVPGSGESPLTFNAPLTRTVNTISIPQADVSHNGYLSLTDWTTFNAKQAALGFTPLNAASNLSDVASASSARTNLGLGTAATHPLSDFLQAANNLSDVANPTTARANIGAGTGNGTVTSVGLSTPGVFYSVSGSPVTTTGTLALALINQSANCTFAGPASGSAAAPTCRALVNADVPSTLSSKTFDNTNTANFKGSLFTLQDATDTTKRAQFSLLNISTATTRTVNLPDANSTTVQSSSAGANQFATGISAQGVLSYAQPSFSNLGGSITTAQQPSTTINSVVSDTNITGSISAQALTLGFTGSLSKARQHAATVYNDQANTFGAFVQTFQAGANFILSDPTDTTKKAKFDVSNIATGTTRTVNVPDTNSTTAQAKSATANQFITAMSAQGVFSAAQPAFSDISGTCAVTQGCTGQTSYTNGQLLIGNTTGNTLTKATLTQGTGITVTNGAGSITVANAGVTSIAGTTNQVVASASTGAVTLSLPQSIATSSDVTFNKVSIGAPDAGLLVTTARFNLFGTTAGTRPYFTMRETVAGIEAIMGCDTFGLNGCFLGTVSGHTFAFRSNNTNWWYLPTTGHFFAVTDNTNDIGASGANRPRTIYAGTSVSAPTITLGSSVTWTKGAGAPAGACTTGSLYSNSTGTADSTLYVCENSVWAAK